MIKSITCIHNFGFWRRQDFRRQRRVERRYLESSATA